MRELRKPVEIDDSIAEAFVAQSDDAEALFSDLYVDRPDDEESTDPALRRRDRRDGSVATLRRRRRRLSPDANPPVRVATLVMDDRGLLHWVDGVPVQPRQADRRRRRARRAAGPTVADTGGSVVHVREFVVLEPNKIVAAIGKIDSKLNPALTNGTCLRTLVMQADGTPALTQLASPGPFAGRTLLVVHGTFSSGENVLGEFAATPHGRRFLERALTGAHRYDRVLFFEQATLGVSPWMNALDLARLMAGSSGEIDVIAHSRGGIVVRWWLETFGNTLHPSRAVRVVLAGSPIAGTSLAAPDKLRKLVSLTANLGHLAATTMGLAATANPFLWVGEKLFEVLASTASALAGGPMLDAIAAIVPGLCAQSRVSNNHELDRLRQGPALHVPDYFVVKSNFEPTNPKWRIWEYLRWSKMKDLGANAAADVIFPRENDLVVDTESMSDFGVSGLTTAGDACDFGKSPNVWHCNYFRQKETIDYLITNL